MSLEYLFIRILETCNANCVMCSFALSKDRYRFSVEDMAATLDVAKRDGIRFVRLTGGEPLIHRNIEDFMRVIAGHGMLASVITNGFHLESKAKHLAEAGLAQVIVSIDGSCAPTHDAIRRTDGLFDRAVAGIVASARVGIRVRVNTVAGPSNFRELPALQDLLTTLRVECWELSSLKLNRALDYTAADIADFDDVIRYVYYDSVEAGRLVPMGKVWCGRTAEERARYLAAGITPRPDEICHVVRKVRYYDARNARLYPCSLLPHRLNAESVGVPTLVSSFELDSELMRARANHWERRGPAECVGCSTTAAGYSNELSAGPVERAWAF